MAAQSRCPSSSRRPPDVPSLIDELCPDYVGERRLALSLASLDSPPRAFAAIELVVDYTAALPDGIVLPLELTIASPSPSNFVRRHFLRSRPSSLAFIPQEGGRHLVRLTEVAHNRWWGALTIDVAGETTDPRA